ncbi:hypothetical protein SUGI_0674650 [Cryptomeria japonica]|nr:hypothetical protein SUGI_0674650 [Cryptomeria japonica]
MIIAAHYCTSLAVDVGDTLALGDSLTGNQTIMSKNGTFALGFFNPRGTKNWYIGIWYAQIPDKTVVWVANRDNPIKSMPGILEFSSNGYLRVIDGKGVSVWSTDIGLRGSRAVIMDSGNFIILDTHNESEIVWESFAHVGDTWLPGMKMWKGMWGTSWKSSVDPATGLFSVGMDMSPGKTQMLMVYNNSFPYWSTGEWKGNYYAKVPEVYAPRRFQMSCGIDSPSRIYYMFKVMEADHAVSGRIHITEKGLLKVYYLMDDSTWSEGWSTFHGQCTDYDICGANGLCNADDGACNCVQGFTPNKPETQGWWQTGCARQRSLQCSATEGTTDSFMEVKTQYSSEKEAVIYKNEPTQQGCRIACLNNCSCTAFAFVISYPPVCRLWFGNLFKMRVSSDQNQSVFIRLADSGLGHSTSEGSRKHPHIGIILPVAGAAIAAVLALLLVGFLLWKRRRQTKKSMEEDVPTSLRIFTYKELRIATQNFKHKLGSGAFGSVFKGTLPDNTLVAVKRNFDLTVEESRIYFPTWMSSEIQRGNIIGIVDARIANVADMEEVRRVAMLGMLCVQDDENMRPSMGKVVNILKGTMEAAVTQIPRFMQVLVDQVDDEDSNSFQITSTSKTT